MNMLLSTLSRSALAFCFMTHVAYGMEPPGSIVNNEEEASAFRLRHPAHCEACEVVGTLKFFPRNLSMINLRDYPGVTQECLESLTYLRSIIPAEQKIDLSRLTQINTLCLMPGNLVTGEEISKCTSLTSLSVNYCPSLTDEHLAPLTHLIDLSLFSTREGVTGQSLSPNLRILQLYGNKTFTNESLKRLSSLTSLTIEQNRSKDCLITDEGLADCTTLTSLRINTRLITDNGVSGLTRLTHLDTTENYSDVAYASLTNLTKLRVFNNYTITDVAFASLSNLTDLELSKASYFEKMPFITPALLNYLPKLTRITGINCPITPEESAPFLVQNRLSSSKAGQAAQFIHTFYTHTKSF